MAFGIYYYDKIKEPISLKGEIDYIYGFRNGVYYEKEELELKEHDCEELFEPTFKGEIIDKSIFKVDMNQKDCLTN